MILSCEQFETCNDVVQLKITIIAEEIQQSKMPNPYTDANPKTSSEDSQVAVSIPGLIHTLYIWQRIRTSGPRGGQSRPWKGPCERSELRCASEASSVVRAKRAPLCERSEPHFSSITAAKNLITATKSWFYRSFLPRSGCYWSNWAQGPRPWAQVDFTAAKSWFYSS